MLAKVCFKSLCYIKPGIASTFYSEPPLISNFWVPDMAIG